MPLWWCADVTSPPDAHSLASLSRRPVGLVNTAGMEAVSRMVSLGRGEEKDSRLPACLGSAVPGNAECKVRWGLGWDDDTKEAVGLKAQRLGVQ